MFTFKGIYINTYIYMYVYISLTLFPLHCNTPIYLKAFNHVHVPNFATMKYCNSTKRGLFGDALAELVLEIMLLGPSPSTPPKGKNTDGVLRRRTGNLISAPPPPSPGCTLYCLTCADVGNSDGVFTEGQCSREDNVCSC